MKFRNPNITLPYRSMEPHSPPKSRQDEYSRYNMFGTTPKFRTCPKLSFSANNSNRRPIDAIEYPSLQLTPDHVKCNTLAKHNTGGSSAGSDQTMWEAMEVRYIDRRGKSPSFLYCPEGQSTDQYPIRELDLMERQNHLHRQTVKVEKVVVSNLLDTPREVCGLPGTNRLSEYRPRNNGIISNITSDSSWGSSYRPDSSGNNLFQTSQNVPDECLDSLRCALKQEPSNNTCRKPKMTKIETNAVSETEINEYRKVALEILLERKKVKERGKKNDNLEKFHGYELDFDNIIPDEGTTGFKQSKASLMTQKCLSSSPKEHLHLSRSRSVSSERKSVDMLSKAREQIMKHRERMDKAKQHIARTATLPPTFKAKKLNVKSRSLRCNDINKQKKPSPTKGRDCVSGKQNSKTSTECSPKDMRYVKQSDSGTSTHEIQHSKSSLKVGKRRQNKKDRRCLLKLLRKQNEKFATKSDDQLLHDILKSPTAKAVQALCLFYQKEEKMNDSKEYDIVEENDVSVNDILEAYQKLFLGSGSPSRSISSVAEEKSHNKNSYKLILAKSSKACRSLKKHKSCSPTKTETCSKQYDIRPNALSSDKSLCKSYSLNESESSVGQVVLQTCGPCCQEQKLSTQGKGDKNSKGGQSHKVPLRNKTPRKSYSHIHCSRIKRSSWQDSGMCNSPEFKLQSDKPRRMVRSLTSYQFNRKNGPKIKRHMQPFGDKGAIGSSPKTSPIKPATDSSPNKKRAQTKYTVLNHGKPTASQLDKSAIIKDNVMRRRRLMTHNNIVENKKSPKKHFEVGVLSKQSEKASRRKRSPVPLREADKKTKSTKTTSKTNRLSSKIVLPTKYKIVNSKQTPQLKSKRRNKQNKKSPRASNTHQVSFDKVQMTHSDTSTSRGYSKGKPWLDKNQICVSASDCHQEPLQYLIRQKGPRNLVTGTINIESEPAEILEDGEIKERQCVSQSKRQEEYQFTNPCDNLSHDDPSWGSKSIVMSISQEVQYQPKALTPSENKDQEPIASENTFDIKNHSDPYFLTTSDKMSEKFHVETCPTNQKTGDGEDNIKNKISKSYSNESFVLLDQDRNIYHTNCEEFRGKSQPPNVKSNRLKTMETFENCSKINVYQLQNQTNLQKQNPSPMRPSISVSETGSRRTLRNYWTRPNSGVMEVKITLRDNECNRSAGSREKRNKERKKDIFCNGAITRESVLNSISLNVSAVPDHSENSSGRQYDTAIKSEIVLRPDQNEEHYSESKARILNDRIGEAKLNGDSPKFIKRPRINIINNELDIQNVKNEIDKSPLENDSTYISSKMFSTHVTSKLISNKEDYYHGSKENNVHFVSSAENVEKNMKTNKIYYHFGNDSFQNKTSFLESKSDSCQITNNVNDDKSKGSIIFHDKDEKSWKISDEWGETGNHDTRRTTNINDTTEKQSSEVLSESDKYEMKIKESNEVENVIKGRKAEKYVQLGKKSHLPSDLLKDACYNYGRDYAAICNMTVLEKAQYLALKHKHPNVKNLTEAKDIEKILEIIEDGYSNLDSGDVADFYKLIGFSTSDEGSSEAKSKANTNRSETQSLTLTYYEKIKESAGLEEEHAYDQSMDTSFNEKFKTRKGEGAAKSVDQTYYSNKKEPAVSGARVAYNRAINSMSNFSDSKRQTILRTKSLLEAITIPQSLSDPSQTTSQSSDERDKSETLSSNNFREKTVRNVANYFSKIRPSLTPKDIKLNYMKNTFLNKECVRSNQLQKDFDVILREESNRIASKQKLDTITVNNENKCLDYSPEKGSTKNDTSISNSNSAPLTNKMEETKNIIHGGALNIIKENYSKASQKGSSSTTELTITAKDSKQLDTDKILKSTDEFLSNKDKPTPLPSVPNKPHSKTNSKLFLRGFKDQDSTIDGGSFINQISKIPVSAEQNEFRINRHSNLQGYWNDGRIPYGVLSKPFEVPNKAVNRNSIMQFKYDIPQFSNGAIHHGQESSVNRCRYDFKDEVDLPNVFITNAISNNEQQDDVSHADDSDPSFISDCNGKRGNKEKDVFIERCDDRFFGANSISQVSVRTKNEMSEKDSRFCESGDASSDSRHIEEVSFNNEIPAHHKNDLHPEGQYHNLIDGVRCHESNDYGDKLEIQRAVNSSIINENKYEIQGDLCRNESINREVNAMSSSFKTEDLEDKDVILKNGQREMRTDFKVFNRQLLKDNEAGKSIAIFCDAKIIGDQYHGKTDGVNAYDEIGNVDHRCDDCFDCTLNKLHKKNMMSFYHDHDRKTSFIDVCDWTVFDTTDGVHYNAPYIIPPPVEFRTSGTDKYFNTDIAKCGSNDIVSASVRKISSFGEQNIKTTHIMAEGQNDKQMEGKVTFETGSKSYEKKIHEFALLGENNEAHERNNESCRKLDYLNESSKDSTLKLEISEKVTGGLVKGDQVALEEYIGKTYVPIDTVEKVLDISTKEDLCKIKSPALEKTRFESSQSGIVEKSVIFNKMHEKILSYDVVNRHCNLIEATNRSVNDSSGFGEQDKIQVECHKGMVEKTGILRKLGIEETKKYINETESQNPIIEADATKQGGPLLNSLSVNDKCRTVQKCVANIERGDAIENSYASFKRVNTPVKTDVDDEKNSMLRTITANLEKGEIVKTIVSYLENGNVIAADRTDETPEKACSNFEDETVDKPGNIELNEKSNTINRINIRADNNETVIEVGTGIIKKYLTEQSFADNGIVSNSVNSVKPVEDDLKGREKPRYNNRDEKVEEHVTCIKHVITVDASVQADGFTADIEDGTIGRNISNVERGAQGDQRGEAVKCCECNVRAVKECGGGELIDKNKPSTFHKDASPPYNVTHDPRHDNDDPTNLNGKTPERFDCFTYYGKLKNRWEVDEDLNKACLWVNEQNETDKITLAKGRKNKQPGESNIIHRPASSSKTSVNNEYAKSVEAHCKPMPVANKISLSSSMKSSKKHNTTTLKNVNDQKRKQVNRFSPTLPNTRHSISNGIKMPLELRTCALDAARIHELKPSSNDDSTKTTFHQFDTDETYNLVEKGKLSRDSMAITSHQFDTDTTSKRIASDVETVEIDTDREIDTEALIDSLSFLEDGKRDVNDFKNYRGKNIAFGKQKLHSYTKSSGDYSFAEIPNLIFPDVSPSDVKRSPVQCDVDSEKRKNTSIADDTVKAFLEVFSKRFMTSLEQTVSNFSRHLKEKDQGGESESEMQVYKKIQKNPVCTCCRYQHFNKSDTKRSESNDSQNNFNFSKVSSNFISEKRINTYNNITDVKQHELNEKKPNQIGHQCGMPNNESCDLNHMVARQNVESINGKITYLTDFEQETVPIKNYQDLLENKNEEGKRMLFETSEKSTKKDQERHHVLFEHILNTMAYDIQAYFDHLKNVAVTCQAPERHKGCSRDILFFRRESPPAQGKYHYGNIQNLRSHHSWNEKYYSGPALSGYNRHMNSLKRAKDIRFNQSSPLGTCLNEPRKKETISSHSFAKRNPIQISVGAFPVKRKNIFIQHASHFLLDNDIGCDSFHPEKFNSLPGMLIPTSNVYWEDVVWNDSNASSEQLPRKRSPLTIRDHKFSNRNVYTKRMNTSRSDNELDTFNELGSFTTEMQSPVTLSFYDSFISDKCFERYDSSTDLQSESSTSSLDYIINQNRKKKSKAKNYFCSPGRRASMSPNKRCRLKEYGSTSTSTTGFTENQQGKTIPQKSFLRQRRHMFPRALVSVCKHEIDQEGIQQQIQSIISMSLLKFMTDVLHSTRSARCVIGLDTNHNEPEALRKSTPKTFLRKISPASFTTIRNFQTCPAMPSLKSNSDDNIKYFQDCVPFGKTPILSRRSDSLEQVDIWNHGRIDNGNPIEGQNMPSEWTPHELVVHERMERDRLQKEELSGEDSIEQESLTSTKGSTDDHLSWLVQSPIPGSLYTSFSASHTEEITENHKEREYRGTACIPQISHRNVTRCKTKKLKEHDKISFHGKFTHGNPVFNMDCMHNGSYLGRSKKYRVPKFQNCFENKYVMGLHSYSNEINNFGISSPSSYYSTRFDRKKKPSLIGWNDESTSQSSNVCNFLADLEEGSDTVSDSESKSSAATRKHINNECGIMSCALQRLDRNFHQLKGREKSQFVSPTRIAEKFNNSAKRQGLSHKMSSCLSSPNYLPKRFSPRYEHSGGKVIRMENIPEVSDYSSEGSNNLDKTNDVNIESTRHNSSCCIGARGEVFDSYINRLSEIRSDMHAKFENIFQCKKATKSLPFMTSSIVKGENRIIKTESGEIDPIQKGINNVTLSSFLDNIHSEDGWSKCWNFGNCGTSDKKAHQNISHERVVTQPSNNTCENMQYNLGSLISDDSALKSKSQGEDQSQSNMGQKRSDLAGTIKYSSRRRFISSESVMDSFQNCEFNHIGMKENNCKNGYSPTVQNTLSVGDNKEIGELLKNTPFENRNDLCENPCLLGTKLTTQISSNPFNAGILSGHSYSNIQGDLIKKRFDPLDIIKTDVEMCPLTGPIKVEGIKISREETVAITKTFSGSHAEPGRDLKISISSCKVSSEKKEGETTNDEILNTINVNWNESFKSSDSGDRGILPKRLFIQTTPPMAKHPCEANSKHRQNSKKEPATQDCDVNHFICEKQHQIIPIPQSVLPNEYIPHNADMTEFGVPDIDAPSKIGNIKGELQSLTDRCKSNTVVPFSKSVLQNDSISNKEQFVEKEQNPSNHGILGERLYCGRNFDKLALNIKTRVTQLYGEKLQLEEHPIIIHNRVKDEKKQTAHLHEEDTFRSAFRNGHMTTSPDKKTSMSCDELIRKSRDISDAAECYDEDINSKKIAGISIKNDLMKNSVKSVKDTTTTCSNFSGNDFNNREFENVPCNGKNKSMLRSSQDENEIKKRVAETDESYNKFSKFKQVLESLQFGINKSQTPTYEETKEPKNFQTLKERISSLPLLENRTGKVMASKLSDEQYNHFSKDNKLVTRLAGAENEPRSRLPVNEQSTITSPHVIRKQQNSDTLCGEDMKRNDDDEYLQYKRFNLYLPCKAQHDVLKADTKQDFNTSEYQPENGLRRNGSELKGNSHKPVDMNVGEIPVNKQNTIKNTLILHQANQASSGLRECLIPNIACNERHCPGSRSTSVGHKNVSSSPNHHNITSPVVAKQNVLDEIELNEGEKDLKTHGEILTYRPDENIHAVETGRHNEQGFMKAAISPTHDGTCPIAAPPDQNKRSCKVDKEQHFTDLTHQNRIDPPEKIMYTTSKELISTDIQFTSNEQTCLDKEQHSIERTRNVLCQDNISKTLSKECISNDIPAGMNEQNSKDKKEQYLKEKKKQNFVEISRNLMSEEYISTNSTTDNKERGYIDYLLGNSPLKRKSPVAVVEASVTKSDVPQSLTLTKKGQKVKALLDKSKQTELPRHHKNVSKTINVGHKCLYLNQKNDAHSRDRSPLHTLKEPLPFQSQGPSRSCENHSVIEQSGGCDIDSIVDSRASRRSSKSYRLKSKKTDFSFPVEIKAGSPHQIVEDFKKSKVRPSQIPVDVYKVYSRGKRSFRPSVRTLTISGPLMNMNIPVFRHGSGEVKHPKARRDLKAETHPTTDEHCKKGSGKGDEQLDPEYIFQGTTPTGQENINKPKWMGVMKKLVPFGKKKMS